MDRALAERLRELGGKLLEEKRWRQDFSEGVVRATGRRTGAENDRDLWFGLKVHASPHRDSKPDADLELHFTRHGYVGLCSLSGGVVNVCGLFSRRTKRTTESQHAFMTAGASCQATTDARDLLRGEPGSILRQRLARAEFHEHSFCAVAGLSLTPWRACLRTEFSLGDSITMIPPMTGNGMSMAFESAEMAVEPLAAWSRGKLTWLEAQQSHSRQCDVVFSRRLRWARWLQQVALMPKMQNILLRLLSASDWCWRSMFEKTR
jgi:2-polyprenyl-6-methoxyphenol hydroxylase-like FAD-dependent oxidoreductase